MNEHGGWKEWKLGIVFIPFQVWEKETEPPINEIINYSAKLIGRHSLNSNFRLLLSLRNQIKPMPRFDFRPAFLSFSLQTNWTSKKEWSKLLALIYRHLNQINPHLNERSASRERELIVFLLNAANRFKFHFFREIKF